MRAKLFIENIDDIGDRQFRGAVDRCLEITPEACQQSLPVELAVRHLVKLVFQLCGEVILDIAREEIVQEGDHKPAAILGDELAAVLDHIGPVLKHLDDRGIGRGAADPEFFHRLDQAGIGEAWRRLGEMLLRGHLAGCQCLAAVDRRQNAGLVALVARWRV